MSNRLIRKSAIYLLATGLNKGLSGLLIPIYAIAVSAADLGSFDYLQTITGICAPVVYVAIWEAVIRFGLGLDSATERDQLLGTTILFCLLVSAGVMIVGAVLSAVGVLTWDALGLAALLTAFGGLSLVWQYAARTQGRLQLFVVSGAGGAAVNLIGVVVLVWWLKMGYWGLCIAYGAGLVFTVLLIETRLHLLRLVYARCWDVRMMRRLLSFSAPLVFNLVFLLLISGFGRLLLTNLGGSGQNGLYVFGMKFAVLVTAVGSVVSMASVEEVILRIGSSDLAAFFGSILACLWGIFLSAATVALPLVYGFFALPAASEYAASRDLVPVFLLYGVFSVMATNYGNAFQAKLRTRYIAWTTVAGGALVIALSPLLIAPLGAMGVALALLAGTLLMLLLRLMYARVLIGFRTDRSLVFHGLLFGAMWLLVSSASDWSGFIGVLGMAVIGVAAVVAGAISFRRLRAIPDSV